MSGSPRRSTADRFRLIQAAVGGTCAGIARAFTAWFLGPAGPF